MLSSNKHKKISLKEYENYVLSVVPLPIDLAKDLEKKQSRFEIKFMAMFVILFHILIIGLFLYFGNVPIGQRGFLLCMGTLLIISVLWIMHYRHRSKYTATLLPYGIEIGSISSEKMLANNYLAINAIDNMVLLEKISEFIKYRKDGLLNMDFYALRIDDYFEIINLDGQQE